MLWQLLILCAKTDARTSSLSLFIEIKVINRYGDMQSLKPAKVYVKSLFHELRTPRRTKLHGYLCT